MSFGPDSKSGVPVSVKGPHVLQDEMKTLKLAGDLSTQIPSKLSPIACSEISQSTGPVATPKPFDLSDAMERQQASDPVGVAGLLGRKLSALTGETLGILLLGRGNDDISADAAVPQQESLEGEDHRLDVDAVRLGTATPA
jgi:hypothetical protein